MPIMKMRAALLAALLLGLPVAARTADRAAPVRKAVESFYKSFGDGFAGTAGFATEDWNHINPSGGWTRNRQDVLREVREVHSTFLKGVTDTIEEIDVRFASPDVAVATVTSRMSPFRTPDSVEHPHDRPIRTFVVVKRHGRWLVMQDQNTTRQ
jgi:uncharacterized protein (TIGR02246 family)